MRPLNSIAGFARRRARAAIAGCAIALAALLMGAAGSSRADARTSLAEFAAEASDAGNSDDAASPALAGTTATESDSIAAADSAHTSPVDVGALAEPETTVVRLRRSRAFEATILSLAATAGPIAYYYASSGNSDELDWPILAAVGGLMLGPAVGYVYAGMSGRGLAGIGVRVLAVGLAGVSGGGSLLVIPASAGYDIVRLAPNLERRDRLRVIELTTARLRTSPAPALALHVSF